MASFSTWTEAVILIILVVATTGFIIADANSLYGKSNSMLLSNETQSALGTLANYTNNSLSQVTQGTPSVVALGLTLSTLWDVIRSVFLILWNVISGNWIPTLIVTITQGWPGAVLLGRILQAVFLISIIYALIRLLMRIKP
jgi:hypothetical protein